MTKIKGLTRSDTPICKLDLRSTLRSMIGNIKETFPPKTEMQKSNFLSDLRYVGGVEGACCLQHPAWNITRKYPMSKVSKEIKTSIKHLKCLFLMYKGSKVTSLVSNEDK